jgi:hypothetical protein
VQAQRTQIDGTAGAIALIDRAATLVTFSGMHAQQLSGMAVESAEYTRRFVDYFNQVWPTAERVDKYLRRIDSAPS